MNKFFIAFLLLIFVVLPALAIYWPEDRVTIHDFSVVVSRHANQLDKLGLNELKLDYKPDFGGEPGPYLYVKSNRDTVMLPNFREMSMVTGIYAHKTGGDWIVEVPKSTVREYEINEVKKMYESIVKLSILKHIEVSKVQEGWK